MYIYIPIEMLQYSPYILCGSPFNWLYKDVVSSYISAYVYVRGLNVPYSMYIIQTSQSTFLTLVPQPPRNQFHRAVTGRGIALFFRLTLLLGPLYWRNRTLTKLLHLSTALEYIRMNTRRFTEFTVDSRTQLKGNQCRVPTIDEWVVYTVDKPAKWKTRIFRQILRYSCSSRYG